MSEGNETVGEIEQIGVRGETLVAIVGVGGFLGLGERDIALPLDRLEMRDDVLVAPNRTESELENMPEYSESEVQQAESGQTLRELLPSDG